MNIPDEAEKRYPALNPDAEELTYPRSVVRGFKRSAFEAGAEWARKEALTEVLRVAEENRVIMKTIRRGYTVEDYSDPLVRIAVIQALAEGVRS